MLEAITQEQIQSIGPTSEMNQNKSKPVVTEYRLTILGHASACGPELLRDIYS
jgi:hypothetical protein